MKTEVLTTQRQLVGLRHRMSDAEVVTEYVFPFLARDWTVAFYVIDAMAYGPRVFQGSLEMRAGGLSTTAGVSSLEAIGYVPLARFDELVHFDPWWAFRGIAGVDRAWVRAILASNIAGTFDYQGSTLKAHDLEFDPSLKRLEALVAKDAMFRTISLGQGDIDLLQLRSLQGK